MVIQWLYKRIFNNIFDQFETFINSKEGKEYINSIIDDIVDRQISRFQGSAGGVMHTPSGVNNQTLIGSILNAIIPNILNKMGGNSTPTAEVKPYGTF